MDLKLGVEEEYFLIDKNNLSLLKKCDKALSADLAHTLSATREMYQCQLEIATPPCTSINHLEDTLKSNRLKLKKKLASYNLSYTACSSYPCHMHSDPIELNNEKYYLDNYQKYQSVNKLGMVNGLHIHVELLDEVKKFSIMQKMKPFLPLFLALSTSSPFYNDQLYSLQSYRTFIWETLPSSRFPPNFQNEGDFNKLIKTLVKAGFIEASNQLYWHIRPGHKIPTLELRICDLPPCVDDTISLTALYSALVHTLNEKSPEHLAFYTLNPELLNHNLWQARRYPLNEAGFINTHKDGLLTLKDAFNQTIEFVRPQAKALNCLDKVERLIACFEEGTSADRQRKCYQKSNNIHAVQQNIHLETHEST